jgi:Na+/proline symporter
MHCALSYNFNQMQIMDWALVGAFTLWILVTGFFTKADSEEDFYFGKGKASWWQMAISIAATEASALTFIAIPVWSFSTDNSFWNIYFGALVARPLISKFFLTPFYEKMATSEGTFTTYGYIGSVLGNKAGTTSMVFFMLMRILASGVRLYVAALLIQQLTGLNLHLSLVLFLGLALIYCYSGGIHAVIRTDIIQFLFLVGSGIAIYLWFFSEGAFEFPIPDEKLKSLSFEFSLKESYTIPTALLSIAIFDLATHAADFDMFQRLMAGKDIKAAKKAIVTSSFISMFVGGLFLAVGIAFYGYVQYNFPDLPSNPEKAYTYTLVNLLPTGFKGLVIAGLLAASLSSLDSALTAIETVFSKDIFSKFTDLNFPRLAVFGVSALGLFIVAAWASTSQDILALGLQVQAFIIVPILGFLISARLGLKRGPYLHLIAFFLSMGVQLYLVKSGTIAWAWGPLFAISTYFAFYFLSARLVKV